MVYCCPKQLTNNNYVISQRFKAGLSGLTSKNGHELSGISPDKLDLLKMGNETLLRSIYHMRSLHYETRLYLYYVMVICICSSLVLWLTYFYGKKCFKKAKDIKKELDTLRVSVAENKSESTE